MKTLNDIIKDITPLPWVLQRRNATDFKVMSDEPRLPQVVTHMNTGLLERVGNNARYLVHCANTMPGMVQALKDLDDATTDIGGGCSDRAWERLNEARQAAQSALEKAERVEV